jgi:undecaprenyl diphosphate synthase
MSKKHVAIIMDGNGRWAEAQGLPRSAGHLEGVQAVRRIVEASPAQGVGILTLYAFSSDNWQRPPEEVDTLMFLLEKELAEESMRLQQNGVRLSVIGRRDRLPASLSQAIAKVEYATAGGTALHLRLAIDYSARDAILRAASCITEGADRTAFAQALGLAYGGCEPAPEVDLLIRTSGEQRLSDFLLWECAYAELYFTDTTWPDFTAEDLQLALESFHHRTRRFGRLPTASGDGALGMPVPVYRNG